MFVPGCFVFFYLVVFVSAPICMLNSTSIIIARIEWCWWDQTSNKTANMGCPHYSRCIDLGRGDAYVRHCKSSSYFLNDGFYSSTPSQYLHGLKQTSVKLKSKYENALKMHLNIFLCNMTFCRGPSGLNSTVHCDMANSPVKPCKSINMWPEYMHPENATNR